MEASPVWASPFGIGLLGCVPSRLQGGVSASDFHP
jgi:hypothetical protein